MKDVQALDVLLHAYLDNINFIGEIKWLLSESHFNGLYQMQGDGNCFYRAFGFAYVKTLMTLRDPASLPSAVHRFESSFSLLVDNGMDEDIIRDFFEPFQNLVRQASRSTLSLDALHDSFNDPETSNSVVMYLRLITSTYLKVCPTKLTREA